MGLDDRPQFAQFGPRRIVQAQKGKLFLEGRVVPAGGRGSRGLTPCTHVVFHLGLLREIAPARFRLAWRIGTGAADQQE